MEEQLSNLTLEKWNLAVFLLLSYDFCYNLKYDLKPFSLYLIPISFLEFWSANSLVKYIESIWEKSKDHEFWSI